MPLEAPDLRKPFQVSMVRLEINCRKADTEYPYEVVLTCVEVVLITFVVLDKKSSEIKLHICLRLEIRGVYPMLLPVIIGRLVVVIVIGIVVRVNHLIVGMRW